MNNDKIWLDCLFAKTFNNGFVLNIHAWKTGGQLAPVYDVRLGYLNDETNNPVLILLETNNLQEAKQFCENFIINTTVFYNK